MNSENKLVKKLLVGNFETVQMPFINFILIHHKSISDEHALLRKILPILASAMMEFAFGRWSIGRTKA